MPYVSRNVPKIDYKIKEHRRIDLDPEFLERIDTRIAEQIQGGLVVHEEAEKVSVKDDAKVWLLLFKGWICEYKRI